MTRSRLAELAAATSDGAPSITWQVEPGRIVLGGEALEPAALFASVAGLLQSLGLASLEVRGPLSVPVGAALLNVLVRAKAGISEPGTLVRSVEQLTGGAVRVTGYSAGAFNFQAAVGPTRPGGAAPSLHEMSVVGEAWAGGDEGGGMPTEGPVRDVLDLFRQHRSGAAVGGTGRSGGAPADGAVRDAIAMLEEPDRNSLLELLGAGGAGVGGSLSFDDAAGVLSLMPADQVSEAIRVLERQDAKPSVTGLMVLRRLARVSLGNPAEFNRLASVANSWAGRPDEPDSALAEMTGTLLTRISQTEFRPEEYTRLLEELINSPAQLAMGISVAMGDDVSRARLRAFEVLCEVMESACERPADSHPLRLFLRAGGGVADLGRADLIIRALKIASAVSEKSDGGGRDNDALAIAQTAGIERWVARAIGACGDAAKIREALRALDSPALAAEALVGALILGTAPSRRRAVMECAGDFGAAELSVAARKAVLANPEAAPGLTDLVGDLCADDAFEIFAPALHHTDRECRIRAFEALAQLGLVWPRDLCVLGLRDMCEAIRMATIAAIARTPGPNTRLVVDRLAGDFSTAGVTPSEGARLAKTIEGNQSRQLTNYLAWKVIVRAMVRHPGVDLGALAGPLRARGRTALSLAAMWVCPVWGPAQAGAGGRP